VDFAGRLEAATLSTIADGLMTGDLAEISGLGSGQALDTEAFLLAVAERL
jgi:isocitrate dehydrogenase